MPSSGAVSTVLAIAAFALVGCAVQDSAPVLAPNSSASNSAAPSPSSTPADVLVYVNECDRAKLYKPSTFTFDCASTPNSLVDLKWSTWDAKEAVGTGRLTDKLSVRVMGKEVAQNSPVRVHLTTPDLGKAGLGFTGLKISVFDNAGQLVAVIESVLKPPNPSVPASTPLPTHQPTTTGQPRVAPAPTNG